MGGCLTRRLGFSGGAIPDAQPVLKAQKIVDFAGSTSNLASIDLTSGWHASHSVSTTYAPVQNDIILVGFGVASNASADLDLAMVTADYAELADLYENSTVDAQGAFFIKRMGGSPDTAVQVGQTGSVSNAGQVIIQVWGGVDPTTALDVTPTTAGSSDTARVDAAAITPVTLGAVIVIMGFGATIFNGTAFSQSGAELSNFQSRTSFDNNHVIGGVGWAVWSGSGAFNPVEWVGAPVDTNEAFVAITLALRPA